MASRRHMRRRACEGKQRHVDQAGAVAHMISLKRIGDSNLNSYKCPHCKGWHVGHRMAR